MPTHDLGSIFTSAFALWLAVACGSPSSARPAPLNRTGASEPSAQSENPAIPAPTTTATTTIARANNGLGHADEAAAQTDALAEERVWLQGLSEQKPPDDELRSRTARIGQIDLSASTSIGGPNNGSLQGGIALPEFSWGLVSNPKRPNHDAYFGTAETVRSLVRGAAFAFETARNESLFVASPSMPSVVYDMWVNDIGFERGGTIVHHGSHRAGRDVDVLFFYRSPTGEVARPRGVPVDQEGRGTDFNDLLNPSDDEPMVFDATRTWLFIQGVIEEETSQPIQRIFVAEHIRTMLLRVAEERNVASATKQKFEDITCQPSVPHDDHLHLRFYCSIEDQRAGCLDTPPTYPDRLRSLRAAGLSPAMQPSPRRRPRGERHESDDEAPPAVEEPPMDQAVRDFLARREGWARPPRTGRAFCR